MTSLSKNVYIEKLDHKGNKYNNTYHSTIKMKPINLKSSKYIESSKKIMKNFVRISKYPNIFAKGYTPN